jgi:type I restriction enzyme S subunit
LGALCDVLDQKRKPITKRDRTAGEYPYYGATGILDYVSGYLFDEPLVLVGEDGAKWAPGESTAFAVDGKCWVNNHAHVLRPHRDKVLDDWLIHFLNHSDLSRFVSGLTVPKLNQGRLREIPIPLAPISEQRRILDMLDEVLDKLGTANSNSERNRASTSALFESYLEGVFVQRAAGWRESPLGDLASFRNGINYTKNSRGDRVRIVGVRNFQKNFVVPLDDLDTVTLDGHLAEQDALRRDDILTVRSNGNIELIGRAMLVGEVGDQVSHSGFTIRIRVNRNEVLPRYVCYFLKSASTRRILTGGGTGTNIKSLNQVQLSELMIPFPPIALQKTIVTSLDNLSEEAHRLADVYTQKYAAIEGLRASLLDRAFTGQL